MNFLLNQSKERSRTLDSPKETNFSVPIQSTRKKNTNLSTSAQPIDIPEKPSTSSRPSLSIYTGSPRKNIHSAYHSYFNPLSQSPITPSDYTLSKKKHESL